MHVRQVAAEGCGLHHLPTLETLDIPGVPLSRGDTGFRVDKRLKLDKPTGHNYMSSETRPIKATKQAFDTIRANEIAIENSKTGKVTALVVA